MTSRIYTKRGLQFGSVINGKMLMAPKYLTPIESFDFPITETITISTNDNSISIGSSPIYTTHPTGLVWTSISMKT